MYIGDVMRRISNVSFVQFTSEPDQIGSVKGCHIFVAELMIKPNGELL